ncbi:MAG TPA: T9SS type A sorting domain-containing protein [Flavobacteriales bacterium]|nr:T9SS type A sorting domain-containing protein [Flavobacteriales bacterium]
MKKLLLSILAVGIGSVALAQLTCTDLFFSEYVEGSGNNNAMEIYNPTQGTIDLSQYLVKRYSNGSGTATETINLTGMLASGDVVVVMNGQTDSVYVDPPGYWSEPTDVVFRSYGDIFDGDYPAVMYFNGDDAITLEKLDQTIIDIFGKVQEDPGQAWTSDTSANFTDANGGTWWTKRQTLIRKPSVTGGVSMNPTSFNPTIEWDSLPDDTWDSLGSHTCPCAVVGINQLNGKSNNAIFVYPNPIVAGSFELKASSTIEMVEVFDVIGKVVYRESTFLYRESVKIILGKVNPGIYLVKAALENGNILTKKVLVK